MSAKFNPGDGWREVSAMIGTPPHLIEYDDNGDAIRFWVRVPPVPPLPTAPHTVIRVTWKHLVDESAPPVLTLDEDMRWYGRHLSARTEISAEQIPDRITSWEPLSEPRAVTAKAVLQYAQATTNITAEALEQIAREFEVNS